MPKDKTTFAQDSANVPNMQKTEGKLIKRSANVPLMQQVPGTKTTSQSGSASGSSDSGKGSPKE